MLMSVQSMRYSLRVSVVVKGGVVCVLMLVYITSQCIQ